MTVESLQIPYLKHGPIAVITLSHPPVNALGKALRQQLSESLALATADPAVQAVLLRGDGRLFSAGADAREFGQPLQPPLLPELCEQIENAAKPVVAAIHGMALGGGLELALAAHYRLAIADAKLGLPEVQLGLLPGAGGTQRLPRLIGIEPALELILSGRQLGAEEALQLGLLDEVWQGEDVLAAGLAYTQQLLARQAPPRRTREVSAAQVDPAASRAALAAARASLHRKSRGLVSLAKIVAAIEAVLDRPFEAGLALERALFLQCMASPQHAGLKHAFFAERAAAYVPEAQAAPPRALTSVGVVGGGTMGAGISVALLDAGLAVTMLERDAASLALGRARVENVYAAQRAKGRLDAAGQAAVLARYAGATDYAALAKADLVIEAVYEDFALKQAVFAALDRVCKPGAVLASNTSYLDIDALAAGTGRPADVLGLHFFSPANIMRLLEVVVPAQASAETVATGFALAKRLRKVAVRAGVCDGFIGNRILAIYRQAADALMEDGASPYQIDEALREFGFAMGPFQVADLAGGDIGWAVRQRRAASRDPRARYVQIADRLCERGWFGQKTGRGFYRYPDGERSGVPDPEVLAIVAAERDRAGIVPRSFSNQAIVRRYLAAMINEGANVVQQRIARRPLDVDVVLLTGYGFPRHHGGPMHYADRLGLPEVLADIRHFAACDPLLWQPSPLLLELVARGADFASLNRMEAG